MDNEQDASSGPAGPSGRPELLPFCTGNWVGHWEQAGRAFATALRLEFRDNGTLYGAGQDGAGTFTLCGEYDPNCGFMTIKKLYGNGVRIDMEGTYVRANPPTIGGTWYGKRVAPGMFFLQLAQ